jgi:hypothetical protein
VTEHVSVDESEPVYSLLELATDGGYRLHERVTERVALADHPEPGIAATTAADPASPEYVYTGPCLLAPVDSAALRRGYAPWTYDPETGAGEPLESYGQFREQFLLGGGVPRLSQLVDHWGLTGLDGETVILVLEDEEWSRKLAGLLEGAGIAVEDGRLQADVRRAYGRLAAVFRAYLEVLDNDVSVRELYTADHTEAIDGLLEEATRHPRVTGSYEAEDHYFQRIAMYTTPLWLEYLEGEFGLPEGSLDISDPIRFYDEFYNHAGAGKNIFRELQCAYFGADNDDREHELLVVVPLLSPFEEGYSLETHAAHADACTPRRSREFRQHLTGGTHPDLCRHPLARLLTGFPNRAGLAGRVVETRLEESRRRPGWKRTAIGERLGEDVPAEIGPEPGRAVGAGVQRRRERVRGTRALLGRLESAVTADIEATLAPVSER